MTWDLAVTWFILPAVVTLAAGDDDQQSRSDLDPGSRSATARDARRAHDPRSHRQAPRHIGAVRDRAHRARIQSRHAAAAAGHENGWQAPPSVARPDQAQCQDHTARDAAYSPAAVCARRGTRRTSALVPVAAMAARPARTTPAAVLRRGCPGRPLVLRRPLPLGVSELAGTRASGILPAERSPMIAADPALPDSNRCPTTATPARMGLTGVRSAGRMWHPANLWGATDEQASAVPVHHRSRLGPALQASHDDVTGGPAAQVAGFPGCRERTLTANHAGAARRTRL
jgi:hypothetical protein